MVQSPPGVMCHASLAEADIKGRLHNGRAVRIVLRADFDLFLMQRHSRIPGIHLAHPACSCKHHKGESGKSGLRVLHFWYVL